MQYQNNPNNYFSQPYQGQNTNYNTNSPTSYAQGAINSMSQARTNNLNRNTQIINNSQDPYGQKNEDLGGDLYQQSRGEFIRKVYTLLSIQLIITALICVWAMKTDSFKKIFGNTASIIILSVLLLVMSIVIGCCSDFFRRFGLPILIVFTLIFALLVGVICCSTKPQIVLTATAITAVVVIALTIYSCVTKTDLTGCGPYLFVFLLVLFVFGIVCIFWRNPIVHLVYACLAALLYAIYLIFDTQMVLGKFSNSYSLDDAYFAAIQLYIDIIQIFLQVLQILSYASN